MHPVWLLPMLGLLCRLKHKRTLHQMQHPLYFLETNFHKYDISRVTYFVFLFYATHHSWDFSVATKKKMFWIIAESNLAIIWGDGYLLYIILDDVFSWFFDNDCSGS